MHVKRKEPWEKWKPEPSSRIGILLRNGACIQTRTQIVARPSMEWVRRDSIRTRYEVVLYMSGMPKRYPRRPMSEHSWVQGNHKRETKPTSVDQSRMGRGKAIPNHDKRPQSIHRNSTFHPSHGLSPTPGVVVHHPLQHRQPILPPIWAIQLRTVVLGQGLGRVQGGDTGHHTSQSRLSAAFITRRPITLPTIDRPSPLQLIVHH